MNNNSGFVEASKRISKSKESQSKELDIRYLSLSRIPRSIYELDSLTTLMLPPVNNFEFLESFPLLQKLDFDASLIDDCAFLGQFSKLVSLEIWNLKAIDLSFLKLLPLLENLSICFDYKEIKGKCIDDACFDNLPNLKQFIMIVDVDSSDENEYGVDLIKNFSFMEKNKNLNVLALGGLMIENIDFIIPLANLTRLILHNNLIQDITPISNLQNLKFLNLEGNDILNLQPIHNLRKINVLNISKNKNILIEDYEFLKYLQKLRDLSVANNNLTTIDFIQNLKHLEGLNLNGNLLSNDNMAIFTKHEFNLLSSLSLQDCVIDTLDLFKPLPQLTYLDLSQNVIEKMTSLNGFQRLKTLNLSFNKIKTVPKNWINEAKLEALWLFGNPIENIPSAYLDGINSLKSYFNDKLSNEKVNNVIKLLIVGNQGTGKTYLKKELLGKSAFNNEWRPTENLCYKIFEIDRLPFHHAIQEFWMRSEALVLVTWDLKQPIYTPYYPDYPISYWVDEAKNQHKIWKKDQNDISDKENFVFLVQNKIDLPKHYNTAPDNYGALLEKYSEHSIQKYDIGSGSIRSFKSELQFCGKFILKERLKITHEWISVQKCVEQLPDWSIGEDSLKQIIQTCFSNPSEGILSNMIYWLHNVGTICYIESSYILLKENLVLNAICKIFNGEDWFSKMIQANNGIFNTSILKDFEALAPSKDVLKLMEAYQIAYSLRKEYWCIPSWSCENQKKQVYDIFSREYGLKPHFFKKYNYDFYTYSSIATCLMNISKYAKTHQHWKNGIYFKWEEQPNTYGFFEADMEKYRITIGIAGRAALSLAAKLFATMSNVIGGKADESIAIEQPHFVPIDIVDGYAKRGKESFDYKFRTYNIADFRVGLHYLLQNEQNETERQKQADLTPKIKKMIYFSANPPKTAKRKMEEEVAAIKKVFEPYQETWCCLTHNQVNPTDFLKTLNDSDIEIVHFSGYTINGSLTFTSGDGRTKNQLDAVSLKKTFTTVKKYNPLSLIVLQAANAHHLAQEISKIDIYVLGVEGDVDDDNITQSSDLFYDSLFKHNFDKKRAAAYAANRSVIHLYHNGNKINL
ncbi:MAG: Internalin precursor [Bacteroidota bacterium]